MFGKKIENKLVNNIIEWLLSIVLAVLVFFVVRTFVFRVAQVTGSSMEPTLAHGDMVLLNRFNFFFSNPRVGDIVAFPPCEDDPSRFYIKRIVAIPGDVVDFVDQAFFINGVLLEDDFAHEPIISFGDMHFPVLVEEGRYFVLGDNRNGSRDSRFANVGTVPAEVMVGRVSLRIWPRGRLGQVD